MQPYQLPVQAAWLLYIHQPVGKEKISGGKGERISTGGKDLGEEKGEDLTGGEKALGGKGGKGSQQGKVAKDLREEKGEDLRGGKAVRGKGGERSQGEKAEDLGKKGFRGERRNLSQQGKGLKDLREERDDRLRGVDSLQ